MVKGTICLLSGGIDSFVLIDFLIRQKFEVICLFVDYGQLAARYEYKAFQKICQYEKINYSYKVRLKNFGDNIITGLTNKEIYNDFFPSRNLLLICLASSFLWSHNFNYISIGVIKSTRIFPDCQRDYFNDLEKILSISTNRDIKILTPLEDFTKIDIIKYIKKFKLPFDYSYSCQKGQKDHCKKCPSCKERFSSLKNLKNYLNEI
ncbi:MAG: 7-cyano-7-deazaguanine synthase [Candidatus Thorarchaeota archaeon]